MNEAAQDATVSVIESARQKFFEKIYPHRACRCPTERDALLTSKWLLWLKYRWLLRQVPLTQQVPTRQSWNSDPLKPYFDEMGIEPPASFFSLPVDTGRIIDSVDVRDIKILKLIDRIGTRLKTRLSILSSTLPQTIGLRLASISVPEQGAAFISWVESYYPSIDAKRELHSKELGVLLWWKERWFKYNSYNDPRSPRGQGRDLPPPGSHEDPLLPYLQYAVDQSFQDDEIESRARRDSGRSVSRDDTKKSTEAKSGSANPLVRAFTEHDLKELRCLEEVESRIDEVVRSLYVVQARSPITERLRSPLRSPDVLNWNGPTHNLSTIGT